MRKESENYDAPAGLAIKVAVAVIFGVAALIAVGAAANFYAGVWSKLNTSLATEQPGRVPPTNNRGL